MINQQTTRMAPTGYTGVDGEGPYSYTFKIFQASDITVVVTSSDDSEVEWPYLSTDMTVSGAGLDAGGTVTLTGALLASLVALDFITIYSSVAIDQQSNARGQGAFHPGDDELIFDRMVRFAQQLREDVSRCFKVSPGSKTLPASFAWSEAEDHLVIDETKYGQVAGDRLATSLDSVDSIIVDHETRVGAAEADIISNDGDISALDGRVTLTEADIVTLDGWRTTDTANIAANAAAIAALLPQQEYHQLEIWWEIAPATQEKITPLSVWAIPGADGVKEYLLEFNIWCQVSYGVATGPQVTIEVDGVVEITGYMNKSDNGDGMWQMSGAKLIVPGAGHEVDVYIRNNSTGGEGHDLDIQISAGQPHSVYVGAREIK